MRFQGTTLAQRRASQRNLAKARAVAARRRRHRAVFTPKVVGLLVALVIGLILIRATHGLILLLVVAGGGAYLYRRQRQRELSREWSAGGHG